MEAGANIGISVVMPVYNGEDFLRESIESVLNQTFTDFEFIIADDGSTDGTPEIIASYEDNRIRHLRCEHNYIETLNKAMKTAKAHYIARMDADDVMLPHRLQTQFDFLQNNPDIDVCGSWFQTIEGDQTHIHRTTDNPNEVRIALLTFNPVAHPTVMMRRRCMEKLLVANPTGPYRPDFIYAEDYRMWCELAASGHRITNIPNSLLVYRFSEKQVTRVFNGTMVRNARATQNYWCSHVLEEIVRDVPQMTDLCNELIKLANEAYLPFKSLLGMVSVLYRSVSEKSLRLDRARTEQA